MHDAVRGMLDRYSCQTREDYVNALREILQEIALLGLWRRKFFEHAAFYGGTALRVLHGLDRYSEDLDFSLLKPDPSFSLGAYGDALKREIASFGFSMEIEHQKKRTSTPIDSPFLKTHTYKQLIVVEAAGNLLRDLRPAKKLKIRLEVDTDPPAGFQTETQFVLQPIPFSVRVYGLPDLLAGKLHAILCRKWKRRLKGRDWYDLVWYAGRYPEVRINHLESRMRPAGEYSEEEEVTSEKLHELLDRAVNELDVEQVRREVAPFVRDQRALDVWSRTFFRTIAERIVAV